MAVLESGLDAGSSTFKKNKVDTCDVLGKIDEALEEAFLGGGEKAIQSLRKKGKLTLRERVQMLLDNDSPFLEIAPLAGWRSNYTVGSGAVAGIGIVNGVECVIFGNDPSVKAGMVNDFNIRKLDRALQIATENRLPYISLTESSGADLNGLHGAYDTEPEDALRRDMNHFQGMGRSFYSIVNLSKMGIPTIAVIFGPTAAAGTYQPAMCDYTICVKDQTHVYLASPPFLKVVTGEVTDPESLGGAEMHTKVSGFGDYLAKNEMDAIRLCRGIVDHINWEKQGPGPTKPIAEPKYDSEELLGLVSKDLKSPFDMREVVARVVDGSEFEEFKANYDTNLICGWASIHGFPVGIIGNNGPLFPKGASKGSQFIQLCNLHNTPIIFLHNVPGMMVGTEYEQEGMIKEGAKMLNAVSCSTVPHISIVCGGSFGAGTFAMSSPKFDTRFTFMWPLAKTGFVGARIMAGTMYMLRQATAARRGEKLDPVKEMEMMQNAEYCEEERSAALFAASRVHNDGVIDPRDTRMVLAMTLSACHNGPIKGTKEFGTWRM